MMSTRVGRRALAASLGATMALLFALPAAAAPVELFGGVGDFYVPRPVENSDQVGVRRLLITFDLAANGFGDLIGQECFFDIAAFNGESIHLNNYGVLVTGNSETDIFGTESQANVETTRLEDESHVLGPIIELYNVMLPDDNGTVGTSVEYTVFVDCDVTTSTTGPTPTTGPSSTTPTTGPSTTQPPTDTTTPSTPTTPPPTVRQETTTTTVPPVTNTTLPFTGPPIDAAGVAMAATALLLLGAGALAAARER